MRFLTAFSVLLASAALAAAPDGDPSRGARVFRACAGCHSLEPGRHMTGPSLSGLLGRKAGAAGSFPRYSQALKKSGLVWSAQTLDAWLRDPEALAPGNFMLFEGIKDDQARADLVAFLAVASQPGSAPAGKRDALPELRNAPARAVVKAIRHCRDTYYVTSAAGETIPFWEFNLRFKTDSSENGPRPGAPVAVGQGMRGDRAQIVFSSPAEISRFIEERC